MTTKQSESGIKLTAAVTRKYGAVEATFGAELIIATDANEGPRQAYAVLLDIINDQFAHYESAVLHTSAKETPVYDQKGVGAKPAIVECRELIVDEKNGKQYFHVTGGKWSKHGAAIWPEVLGQYKDLSKFKPGLRYNMTGWKMAVDTSGAAKVVQLIAPA